MIQLRPYQANEVARGHVFTGWPTRDITMAKAILAALPLPADDAARRFPAPILSRLASEWYTWTRNGQLEPTRGAVRQCYDAWIAGHKRVLLAAVTGDGKTEIAVKIAYDCASRGWRCIFVCDQQNLVKQSAARFAKYGLRVGVIWADAKRHGLLEDQTAPIQVASLQTLQASERAAIRQGTTPLWRQWHGAANTLWILDEAHDQTAWSELGQSLLRSPGASWYLGLTGSPFRLSPQQGMGDLFDALAWTRCYRDAVTVSVPEVVAAYRAHGHMIDHCGSILAMRYLGARASAARMDTSGIDRGADGDYNQQQLTRMGVDPVLLDAQYQEWSSHGFQRTLSFCCTVDHATACAAHWSSKGVSTGVVTGDEKTTGIYRNGQLQPTPRETVCARLASGQTRIIFSIAAMIKGVDIAEIDSALCLRPTESFALFVQMVGRARRPCSHLGQLSATWLDMTQNALNFACQLETMAEFRLTKGEAKGSRRSASAPTGKECPRCQSILPPSTEVCPHCGHVLIRPAKPLAAVKIETHEIDTTGTGPSLPSPQERRDRDAFRFWLQSAYKKDHHPGSAEHRHTAITRRSIRPEWFLHAIFRDPSPAAFAAYLEYLKRHALRRDAKRRAAQSDVEFIQHYFRLEFGTRPAINPAFLTSEPSFVK
jgi:superfamily II DNA or RNA helicase